MSYRDVTRFVMKVCRYVRRPQAKTLGVFVWAAMHCRGTSFAALARAALSSTTLKHTIKRLDRFLGNIRLEPSEVMRGVVEDLISQRRGVLPVSLDWMDVRGFMVLMAVARLRGRGVPLLCAAYTKWEFHRSQNNLEPRFAG